MLRGPPKPMPPYTTRTSTRLISPAALLCLPHSHRARRVHPPQFGPCTQRNCSPCCVHSPLQTSPFSHPPTQSDASRPAWVSCYAPRHLTRPGLLSSNSGFSSLGRVRHITGVTFAGAAGGQLLLSYSGDAVYGVDVRQHAMSHEQLDARLRRHAGGRAGERDGSGAGAGSGLGGARGGGPPAALGSPSAPVRAGAGPAVGSGAGGGGGDAVEVCQRGLQC